MINAIVLAYDVYCSLNDAVDIGSKGWDQTLYAVLGSAVRAGRRDDGCGPDALGAHYA